MPWLGMSPVDLRLQFMSDLGPRHARRALLDVRLRVLGRFVGACEDSDAAVPRSGFDGQTDVARRAPELHPARSPSSPPAPIQKLIEAEQRRQDAIAGKRIGENRQIVLVVNLFEALRTSVVRPRDWSSMMRTSTECLLRSPGIRRTTDSM
jgi:hypothetical protein